MKIQKIIQIIAVSTLIVVVAGCGGNGGGVVQPAEPQSTANTQPAAGQPAAEATAAAPAANTPASAAAQPEQPVAPAIEVTLPPEIEAPLLVTEAPPAGDAPRVDAPRISRDPVITGDQPVLREPFQTWCMFAGTGATMGIDGERLNFTCSQAGEVTVGLFGDVQPSESGWMIARKSFRPAADGFEGLLSEMVKVEAVLLHDGMRCYWAGEGATLAYQGKRLNFTCEAANQTEYVLVGEITLGDEGWMIERGIVVRSETGAAIQKAAPVLIDALGVRK